MADNPDVLRPDVVDLILADRTVLVLSAVVAWEVAITWRAGKLVLPEHSRDWVRRLAREFGVERLPIVEAHVTLVADLPDHHRDPFDRLLIARAQVEGVPTVTADRNAAQYEVGVVAAR